MACNHVQVSAEPASAAAAKAAPRKVVAKTEEARLRLREIIRHTLLFKGGKEQAMPMRIGCWDPAAGISGIDHGGR